MDARSTHNGGQGTSSSEIHMDQESRLYPPSADFQPLLLDEVREWLRLYWKQTGPPDHPEPRVIEQRDPDLLSKLGGPNDSHQRRRCSPTKLVLGFSATMMIMAFVLWFYNPKPHLKLVSYVNQSTKVGRLPFMGYNTWNAYACNINETVVLESAQLMKSLGLADAGYEYVGIDDCYSEKQRSPTGDIVASRARFPSGMKSVTDEIHSLGLCDGFTSLQIYKVDCWTGKRGFDSGWFTCQLYPGSYGNEERDARLFQEWGFDLLKYDNCAVPFDGVIKEGMVGKFTRMAKALSEVSKKSGKPPMVFSLCQWGREEPWLWARQLGHTWRTTDDINPTWGSITDLLNRNSFYAWASDFYGHNDMDMLEVGNGQLTYEEAKSHFTAWALMKSPLLIGTHLRGATQETLDILKNREIIAINQDPIVGTSITPFRWGVNRDWTWNWTHPAQYWSGRSENGTVFMLLNTLDEPADMFFSLTESPWIRAGRQYSVRDLWSHTENGTAVRNFTARNVPPHGVVVLLLKDAGDEPQGTEPPCARLEWCMGEDGTRVDRQ